MKQSVEAAKLKTASSSVTPHMTAWHSPPLACLPNCTLHTTQCLIHSTLYTAEISGHSCLPNFPLWDCSVKESQAEENTLQCSLFTPHWMCRIQLKHFSLTPGALFLDHRRTFPWPPAHFSLTPDALLLDPWRTSPWPIFHNWKHQKNWWKKNSKLFLKTLYILKYSYAFVVKS